MSDWTLSWLSHADAWLKSLKRLHMTLWDFFDAQMSCHKEIFLTSTNEKITFCFYFVLWCKIDVTVYCKPVTQLKQTKEKIHIKLWNLRSVAFCWMMIHCINEELTWTKVPPVGANYKYEQLPNNYYSSWLVLKLNVTVLIPSQDVCIIIFFCPVGVSVVSSSLKPDDHNK